MSLGLSSNEAKYLPCMNPSCKSYGSSHPNCRCWGQKEVFFAEGGEIKSGCDKDRAHEEGCEYFAGGGDVLPAFEETQPLSASEPAQPDSLPAFEETEPVALPSFEETEPLPEEKYGTAKQQLIAGAEGLAKGVAGPLATAFETKVLGVPEADIKGRAEANPWTSGIGEAAGFVGGLATGAGQAGLIAKAASKIAPVAESATLLSRMGSTAIQSAIEGGLYQVSDETSKALLGEGDPEAPVGNALANIGAATLLGATVGGLFGAPIEAAAKGARGKLQEISDTKMEKSLRSWLAGYGASIYKLERGNNAYARRMPAEFVEAMGKGLDHAAFKSGESFQQVINGLGKGKARGLLENAVEATSFSALGLPGYVGAQGVNKYVLPHFEKAIGKKISRAEEKFVAPVILKALASGDTQGIGEAIRYSLKVAKGATAIADGVEELFVPGVQKAFNSIERDKEREKTKASLERGDFNKEVEAAFDGPAAAQGFARGGSVDPVPVAKPSGVSRLYPEQSMLLTAARGRIAGHLNSLKPSDMMPKLPFDKPRKDKAQEKRFNRAVDIANRPLSVLQDIKRGTLMADDVKDLSTMYPELKKQLDQAMVMRITKAQLAEEKPSYRVRQSMSLFLGAPLSSEMLPESIQAAQNVFKTQAAQRAQMGQAQKTKKGTAPLTKSDDNAWTADQAAAKRQSNPER